MRITYSPTRTITSSDLFMACDPPITFTVKVKVPPTWARLHRQWEEQGHADLQMTKELIAQSFVTVGQDGDAWPLNTIEAVDELREAIEEQNPNSGDDFLITILDSFAFNHYNFLAGQSMSSAAPLTQSNGSGAKKDRVAVS